MPAWTRTPPSAASRARTSYPLTFPHLLAFPLHMAIMSDPDFPYPAIGMVHVENAITAHRAIGVGEALDVTTSVAAPRPHARGVLLDFTTTVSAGGETAWESTSTYLRRGRSVDGDATPGLELPDPPTGGVEWRLPADLGRTYAAVSGDANPIHLYPLTARALGFPRQIAHGMWTLARSVAAIENRLPDAVTVEVAFKKPVLLPGTVALRRPRRRRGLDLRADQPEGRLAAPARSGDARLRPILRRAPQRRGLPNRIVLSTAAGPRCGAAADPALGERRRPRRPDPEVGHPVTVPVAGHRQVARPRRTGPTVEHGEPRGVDAPQREGGGRLVEDTRGRSCRSPSQSPVTGRSSASPSQTGVERAVRHPRVERALGRAGARRSRWCRCRPSRPLTGMVRGQPRT